MPRRYYRRRNVNRDKYSVENTSIVPPRGSDWTSVPAPGEGASVSKQFAISVIPPTDVQGMRKAKHFTLTFSCDGGDPGLYYALVYVPQGYEPNFIQLPTAGNAISLYEPNQYVISAGVLDFSGGPCRIRSPLSRNLNSGDSIYLVMASTASPDGFVRVNVQYAITLQ